MAKSSEASSEAPAIPLAPIAPAPLTKEEEAKGVELFNAKIQVFILQQKELGKMGLMLNWDKGNFCIDLEQDPRSFGNRSPKQMAEALNVSESSVFKYRQFAMAYSKDRVLMMAEQEVPWRAVIALLTVQSKDKREKFETLLLTDDKKKRISSEDLQEKVKELNQKERATARAAGVKRSERGGARPITIIRAFAGLVNDMLAKKEEFKQAHNDFKAMTDEDAGRSETEMALKEAYKLVKKALEDLTKLEEFRDRMAKK